MAKQRTLEQIEAEMEKLRAQKDALYEKRKALAAERRALILRAPQSPATKGSGSVTLTPDPAILIAKIEQ